MAKTEGLRRRQAELASFARRKGWERGRLGSWRAGRLTIAIAASGYPKPDFVVTDRLTKESRKLRTLEDVDRLIDAVRVTGHLPTASA